MDGIREKREAFEQHMLSPKAALSCASRGRPVEEAPCPIRTCFQRDVDRIIHSKAFRRLKHKTQVFLQPEGDHYRTRLTHTLEVARIARTMARALDLNEDLTEAAALGHDLGHTPFGHAGERALRKVFDDSFSHNEQSLRVVDKLEKDGLGLNLCHETRDAILCHTGPKISDTLEGQVLRHADRIAYINHDLDDALRAGILTENDIPPEITAALGDRYSQRINTAVMDIIRSSRGQDEIRMSPELYFILECFRDFMFDSVYTNPVAKGEETKAQDILMVLFEYYVNRPELLPEEYLPIVEAEGAPRAAADYVAGMTDQYAVRLFSRIHLPDAWRVF